MAAPYLIDSSVICKVFLLDEKFVAETRRLFDAFYLGKLVLLTPALAFVETANAIVKAVRQQRLSIDAADLAVGELFHLGIEIAGGDEQVELSVSRAYPVAIELNRGIYDALFLVLSQALAAPLITADRPLHEAAQERFGTMWIEDPRLP